MPGLHVTNWKRYEAPNYPENHKCNCLLQHWNLSFSTEQRHVQIFEETAKWVLYKNAQDGPCFLEKSPIKWWSPKDNIKVHQRKMHLAGHCIRHHNEVTSKLVLWQSSKRRRGRIYKHTARGLKNGDNTGAKDHHGRLCQIEEAIWLPNGWSSLVVVL